MTIKITERAEITIELETIGGNKTIVFTREKAKELYKELGKIFEPKEAKDGIKRQTALDGGLIEVQKEFNRIGNDMVEKEIQNSGKEIARRQTALDMADKAIKEAHKHWDTSITTSHCEMHGVFYGSICPEC